MIFFKVQRKDFSQAKQYDLSIFGQMVLSKVVDNSTYTSITEQVLDLKAKSLAYDLALVAAANRDKELVNLKNIAKKVFIDSFNIFSNVVEVNAQGSEDYIIETGLSILPKPVRSNIPTIAPKMPIGISIQSVGIVGEVEITMTIPDKKNTVMVAVDNRTAYVDAPYTNGTYLDIEKGVLQGLPPQSFVEVRMRAVGRDNLKSGWTTPIIVPVL